ncbi:MAG: flagellar motor protein [Gammaproteobacteria bacterium]|nr:flagellar motor protein [Gammaproteobacteria bacterium]
MDILSVTGVILAVGAVLLGQVMEGGTLSMLVNGPAILIVVGGTLGATMLQSPLPVFARSMRMASWVLKPPVPPMKKTMKEIVRWSQVARKEGLLGLENLVGRSRDLYARKGLQLLVDGNEPSVIRDTLQLDNLARESRDMQAARVFDGMGGYAPTLGILGAVMGLIQVMGNLANPSMLGEGIAVAFVATVYGVGLANLFFIPVATKLKSIIKMETLHQEMITVGIVAIAEGENPRIIESRLQGLIT